MVAPHPWYNTNKWKHKRKQQLTRDPLCAVCLKIGKVTAATVADHINPHRQDYNLFFNGPLQSLCAQHHNALKQRVEVRGYKFDYDNAVDVNGKPIDPNHPSNTFK